jgi:hypothetical protein
MKLSVSLGMRWPVEGGLQQHTVVAVRAVEFPPDGDALAVPTRIPGDATVTPPVQLHTRLGPGAPESGADLGRCAESG